MSAKHLKVDIDIDDATGLPRAVYFHIRDEAVAETREVRPGKAFADYSAAGTLVGVEMISQCEVTARMPRVH